jgi:hypothetical protein
LHFHVQDREDFFTAVGIPVIFADLVIDGQATAAGQIRTRQRVIARQR